MDDDDDYQTHELENLIFEHPERILITGCSNSGKTFFVEQFVKKYNSHFFKIILCGSKNKLLEFPETRNKTSFYENSVTPIYDPFLDHDQIEVRENSGRQILCIYDDQMSQIPKSDTILNIFSKGRHKSISVILLLQGYFPQGSGKNNYPLIKSNSTIQIFFRLFNVGEIDLISRKLGEKDKKSQLFFSTIMREQVQNKKHGYISVFLEESCENLRYRNNLLNEDNTGYVSVFTK